MLLAWNTDGDVMATCDWLVTYEPETGAPVGVVDFARHEREGGALLDIWRVAREADGATADAVGSGTWPEFLGGAAHDFQVELEPGWSRSLRDRTPYRVRNLVHRGSGYKRKRVDIDAAIAARIATAADRTIDLRDILGGPTKPIELDARGEQRERVVSARSTLPLIPMVRLNGTR